MGFLKILGKIFFNLSGAVIFIGFFVVIFSVMFATTIWPFLWQTVTGVLPFDLLVKLLPSLWAQFVTGGGYIMLFHYLFISFLLSMYAMLISYIFFKKKIFSVSSFSTSLLALVGISLGITCLSCGALAGLILFSAFGAITSSFFVSLNSQIFIIAGEALLIVSIGVVLLTLKRLRI